MKTMIANYMKRFFSHYLPIQKGLSITTIWAYRDAIKLLLCYAADTLRKSADELNVEEIEESLVLAFLDHLENARNCTPRTRNARLAAIHPRILQLYCQRGADIRPPVPKNSHHPPKTHRT